MRTALCAPLRGTAAEPFLLPNQPGSLCNAGLGSPTLLSKILLSLQAYGKYLMHVAALRQRHTSRTGLTACFCSAGQVHKTAADTRAQLQQACKPERCQQLCKSHVANASGGRQARICVEGISKLISEGSLRPTGSQTCGTECHMAWPEPWP